MYRLEFPSPSTFGADVLLGSIRVNHLHVGAIPIEFLSRTSGNIPEQQSLRDQARKFEIPAGLLFTSLAGVEPFALVPRFSWQRLFRLFVAGPFRFSDKS